MGKRTDNILADVIKEYSRPVREILGEKTRWVAAGPEIVESYVVYAGRRNPYTGFEAYKILAHGPHLSLDQLNALRKLIFTPESYYNGMPIFRRFPHVPDFALRMIKEGTRLDLMIDLSNPGWSFYCGYEKYYDWNWVGDDLLRLAKSLFPELASPDPRYVWKKGVIRQLILEKANDD